MPYANLAADVVLDPDSYQTILSVTVDPGLWILLGCVQAFGNSTSFQGSIDWSARVWDGESTFWATTGTTMPMSAIIGDGHFYSQLQMPFMGVADLTAATVPTTIYLQVRPFIVHTDAGAPAAGDFKALTREGWTGAFAATWFVATEFGSGAPVSSFPAPPTTWTASTVHAGLTGSGTITLTSPNNGVEINASTIPPTWGFADWVPTHYIPAWAQIAWGAPGNVALEQLVHTANAILFVPYGAAETVFYSIKPGWVATITEVHGT